MSPENHLEFLQQCRPLLQLRHIMWSPPPLSSTYAAKLKTKVSKVVSTTQVYDATLLFVNLNMEFGKLLPQPFDHRPQHPLPTPVVIDQYHQVISKTRILNVSIVAAACDLLRSLEHPIYLVQVEVTEQR